MSERIRLPSSEPRKASQRRTRRAAPAPTAIEPSWRPGDKVHWRGYVGQFLRKAVDGRAEMMIGTRTYRVVAGELRSVREAAPIRTGSAPRLCRLVLCYEVGLDVGV